MEVSPHLVLDFNLDFSWFFNLKDSRIALLILEEEKKKSIQKTTLNEKG